MDNANAKRLTGYEEALVPVRFGSQPTGLSPIREPIPKLIVANSLQEADSQSFLHVDAKGHVCSPVRYRVQQALSYSLLGFVLTGSMIVYGAAFGLLGVLGWGAVSALLGFRLLMGHRVNQAARLIVANRLDEAEEVLQDVLKKPFLRASLRGRAYLSLGAIAARRGTPEEALQYFQQAQTLFENSRRG